MAIRVPFQLLAALALALFMAWPAAAQGHLVDAQWVAARLQDPSLLVIDASPRPLHNRAHIPGAMHAEVMGIAAFGVRDVPNAQIERVFQAMGVTPGRKVVIYDQGGTWYATRLFFALEYYGFPAADLHVLDGGFAKWQAQGLPVTQEATPPRPGTFRIAGTNEALRSRVPDLLAAAADRGNQVLLDALEPEYHYGARRFFHKAGHIPHALLLPGEDFFNADKTFKSPTEIRRMLAHLGVRPEQEVHAHCGGGGAASIPYFALRHLAGYPNVKLSVESQMGWLRDERDLPFWTYADPTMLREVEWLQTWGGAMMRMVGVGQVSVVDVRPAAAYAQGHVPYAIHVPGETFRSQARDPQRLAALLGSAGVDPAHEAVIVSGGGVTKDAALAFAVLEKLGQKRVSIFAEPLDSVDTLDRMARMNFAPVKEATVVGAPRKPGELAVPAVTYAPRSRAGVLLADAKSGGGAYPKVFLASGARAPARAPEGTVIHVPYTELLNADATPKAAKDIWAILSKAGVPRYAEIVTFSDDPGEAAINYFMLRLMGYPDAKVLLASGGP